MKRILAVIVCFIMVAIPLTSCDKSAGTSGSKTVYTVTAEQWTASMAEDAFKNCEVIWWQGSKEEYNGGEYFSTPAYLSYGDAWFTLKEDPDGSTGVEYRKDGYDWSSDEVAEASSELLGGFGDFIFNAETKRYESVETDEDGDKVTRYAGFEDGRLTYLYCMMEAKDNGSRGYEFTISNYGRVKVTPPIDEAKKAYEAATTEEMIGSMVFEGELGFDLKALLSEQSFDDVQVLLMTNGTVSKIFFSPEGIDNSKDVSVRFRDGKIYRIISPNYSIDISYEE